MSQLHTWQKSYIAIPKTINAFQSQRITINKIMSYSAVTLDEVPVHKASVSLNGAPVHKASVSLNGAPVHKASVSF